jgi:hypothetical protein
MGTFFEVPFLISVIFFLYLIDCGSLKKATLTIKIREGFDNIFINLK